MADDLGLAGKSETAEPALSDVAHLCTELCRVLETREVTPLLKHFAEMLGAIGSEAGWLAKSDDARFMNEVALRQQ